MLYNVVRFFVIVQDRKKEREKKKGKADCTHTPTHLNIQTRLPQEKDPHFADLILQLKVYYT